MGNKSIIDNIEHEAMIWQTKIQRSESAISEATETLAKLKRKLSESKPKHRRNIEDNISVTLRWIDINEQIRTLAIDQLKRISFLMESDQPTN